MGRANDVFMFATAAGRPGLAAVATQQIAGWTRRLGRRSMAGSD